MSFVVFNFPDNNLLVVFIIIQSMHDLAEIMTCTSSKDSDQSYRDRRVHWVYEKSS